MLFLLSAVLCCCLCCFFFLPVVGAYNAKTVEILELEVPGSPQAGQDVTLTCRFHLLGPNHHLYTVNWWRGKDQFYTYKGTATHDPKHAYIFRGIHVKTDESTEESVVLRNVTEETSGVFKCEVMGEGPSFRTAVQTKPMTVIVPPSSVEILTPLSYGHPPTYHTGEKVQVNCTASSAKPRAHLNWEINGVPVRAGDIQHFSDYEDHRRRVTSTAGITWDAPTYFINNVARVSCHAVVGGHTTSAHSNIFLEPASSAALNHLYASTGCQLSTTWTVLGLALLVVVVGRVP
ncbi:hypothetical protein Pmani_014378 [Petrolisthes manimaculis]|uniref:Ig-like domain-containing protein n=1 Tax=Petrolisthes manimaculis TaxID=1843537 RepID=A0AAE1PVT0_9EUCA|nr:hypothetical protein Pmani_014378 [Petrolisthes manimaculis]